MVTFRVEVATFERAAIGGEGAIGRYAIGCAQVYMLSVSVQP